MLMLNARRPSCPAEVGKSRHRAPTLGGAYGCHSPRTCSARNQRQASVR
jgi:hypothetical protein